MIASGAVAMVAAPTTMAAAAPNTSGITPRCRQAADADENGEATRTTTTRPLSNALVDRISVLLSQTDPVRPLNHMEKGNATDENLSRSDQHFTLLPPTLIVRRWPR